MSEPNWVDLTGYRGPTGPQGVKGVQGVQGDPGIAGVAGPQGPTTGIPQRLEALQPAPTGLDWNNLLKNGWYATYQAANGFNSGYMFGFVLNHHDGWVLQLCWDFTQPSPGSTWPIYLRRRLNYAWQGWVVKSS